jgi:hypothetical protein
VEDKMKGKMLIIGLVVWCICGAASHVYRQNFGERPAHQHKHVLYAGQGVTREEVRRQRKNPAPPFEDIRKYMLAKTDAQWREYADGIEGKYVRWIGWIVDVREILAGVNYEVYVDMDHPKYGSGNDVYFNCWNEGTALSLKKGQKVRLRGKIEYVGKSNTGRCIVHLEEVRIEIIGG